MTEDSITLNDIERFAFEQMNRRTPAVEVLGKPCTAVINPWLDRDMKTRMTSEEAAGYWGKDAFDDFIKQSTEYLREQKEKSSKPKKKIKQTKPPQTYPDGLKKPHWLGMDDWYHTCCSCKCTFFFHYTKEWEECPNCHQVMHHYTAREALEEINETKEESAGE